ncbi:hypothetical protein [Antrihabitans stalactiti]|uniref:TrbL/VirB6 plasmid conjugal transfer protein n=1 Tax=Antrihabitans stalactiti TaxID=2584121 RepID=A0A848KRZ4_9NOCA|nr:hypothetical protein [Antrihabitans stalactiti]NMN99312.1 hypothetical protein [Antrihabitans stalactiti]
MGWTDQIGPGCIALPVLCLGGAAKEAVTDVADGWFGKFLGWLGSAAGDMLQSSMTWWVNTDSVDVSPATALGEDPIILAWIGFLVAAGIIVAATTMVYTRRSRPFFDLITGAIKWILVSGMGITVLGQLLHVADDTAQGLVDSGANDFGPNMSKMLGAAVVTNPAALLLLTLLCWVLAFIQFLFGFLRQAGILVLAAMIPIAAAGYIGPFGRQWFPRLAGSLVALAFYKPLAALIYSVGFRFMGQEQSLAAVMTGMAVLVIGVIALPSMMAFFSWMGLQTAPGVSSGTALAGGVAGFALSGEIFDRVMPSGGGSSSSSGSSLTADPLGSYMESNGPGTGNPDPGRPGELGAGQSHNGFQADDAGDADQYAAQMPPQHPDSTGGAGVGTPAAGDGLIGAGVGSDTAASSAAATGASGTAAATGAGTSASAAGASGAAAAGAGAATGGIATAALLAKDVVDGAIDKVEAATDAAGAVMTGEDPT